MCCPPALPCLQYYFASPTSLPANCEKGERRQATPAHACTLSCRGGCLSPRPCPSCCPHTCRALHLGLVPGDPPPPPPSAGQRVTVTVTGAAGTAPAPVPAEGDSTTEEEETTDAGEETTTPDYN